MPGVSVIQRELREAARQPQTYWLRVGGVTAAILVLVLTTVFITHDRTSPTAFARWLFINLQTMVFGLIWVVVPFLTADALSRERREGTLGLLFLTPLKPIEVVVGKGMAQAVRTASLLLGIVPVMSVPLLLGGMSAQELMLALTADLMSLVLALAAGLLASAYSRDFMRAMAAGGLITGLCLACLSIGYGGFVMSRMGFQPGGGWWEKFCRGTALLSGAMDCWRQATFLSGTVGGARGAGAGLNMSQWCVFNGVVLLAAFAVAGAMLILAARRTHRAAWDGGKALLPERLEKVLTEPMLWTRALRSHMRRSLTRNPVGWLHERRAWSRVAKWGLCAVVAMLGTVLVSTGSWYALPQALTLLGVGLVAGLAFTAGSSFKSEQESGLLELLLVTPMTEWQVIVGRMRGLWSQFLPSMVLVAGPLLYLRSLLTSPRGQSALLCEAAFWWLSASLVLVPCVGLAMSVRRLGAVSAWLGTLAVGVLAPLIAGTFLFFSVLPFFLPPGMTVGYIMGGGRSGGLSISPEHLHGTVLWVWIISVVSLQAAAAVVSLLGLFRRLQARQFLAS